MWNQLLGALLQPPQYGSTDSAEALRKRMQDIGPTFNEAMTQDEEGDSNRIEGYQRTAPRVQISEQDVQEPKSGARSFFAGNSVRENPYESAPSRLSLAGPTPPTSPAPVPTPVLQTPLVSAEAPKVAPKLNIVQNYAEIDPKTGKPYEDASVLSRIKGSAPAGMNALQVANEALKAQREGVTLEEHFKRMGLSSGQTALDQFQNATPIDQLRMRAQRGDAQAKLELANLGGYSGGSAAEAQKALTAAMFGKVGPEIEAAKAAAATKQAQLAAQEHEFKIKALQDKLDQSQFERDASRKEQAIREKLANHKMTQEDAEFALRKLNEERAQNRLDLSAQVDKEFKTGQLKIQQGQLGLAQKADDRAQTQFNNDQAALPPVETRREINTAKFKGLPTPGEANKAKAGVLQQMTLEAGSLLAQNPDMPMATVKAKVFEKFGPSAKAAGVDISPDELIPSAPYVGTSPRELERAGATEVAFKEALRNAISKVSGVPTLGLSAAQKLPVPGFLDPLRSFYSNPQVLSELRAELSRKMPDAQVDAYIKQYMPQG